MPTGRNRHSGEGRNPEGRGEWPDVFIPLYGLMKAIVITMKIDRAHPCRPAETVIPAKAGIQRGEGSGPTFSFPCMAS